MPMENHAESPFNALPPVVVALAAVIFGIEVMLQAATLGLIGGPDGVGWRIAAIREYAVFDNVVHAMWDQRSFPPDHLLRFVAYPLIHGGFVHVAFVTVFILAIGKMVCEVFSPLAFAAIFLFSGIMGALGFVLILDSQSPLIGGFPAVYGLIGAFTFILWARASMPDARVRAFGLIAALLAVQLIFGAIQGEYGNVVAEMTGFFAGFALSFLVSPGGWQRVLARLRNR